MNCNSDSTHLLRSSPVKNIIRYSGYTKWLVTDIGLFTCLIPDLELRAWVIPRPVQEVYHTALHHRSILQIWRAAMPAANQRSWEIQRQDYAFGSNILIMAGIIIVYFQLRSADP